MFLFLSKWQPQLKIRGNESQDRLPNATARLTLSLECRGGGAGFSCATSLDDDVDDLCVFGEATRGGGDAARRCGEADLPEVTRGEEGPRGDVGGEMAGNGFPTSDGDGDVVMVNAFEEREENELSSFNACDASWPPNASSNAMPAGPGLFGGLAPIFSDPAAGPEFQGPAKALSNETDVPDC